MGNDREHRGHSGEAYERIVRAREYFETRAERRLTQIWNKVTAAWEKVVAR